MWIDVASLPPYFWPAVGGAIVVLAVGAAACVWRRSFTSTGWIRGDLLDGAGGEPLLQNADDVRISVLEPDAQTRWSAAEIPPHLRLGITLPGMRERYAALPADAVDQVNAGGRRRGAGRRRDAR